MGKDKKRWDEIEQPSIKNRETRQIIKRNNPEPKTKTQPEPETKIEENLSPHKKAKTKSLKIAKTNTNWSRSEIIFDKKSK